MNRLLSDFGPFHPLSQGRAVKDVLLTVLLLAAATLSFFLTVHSCR